MTMVRTIVKRESLSEKVVKYVIYVVMGAVFATFLREPISVWLQTQETILQNDLTINIISVGLGYIVAGLVIFVLKRKSNME